MRIRRRRRFIFCLVRALQMAATVKGASREREEVQPAGSGKRTRGASEGRSQKTLEYALLSERVPSSSVRGTEGGGRAALSTSAAQSHCIPPSLPPSTCHGREGGREGIKRRSQPDLGHGGSSFCISMSHKITITAGRMDARCHDVVTYDQRECGRSARR